MIQEPTNIDRAAWAKEALAVFTARTFSGDHPDTMDRGDLDSAIGDLITDVLHYSLQQGFDATDIVQRALSHFGAELIQGDFSTIDVHQLLSARKQVAVIWCTEDVQSIRSDLTDDQAWQVLQQCRCVHDCEIGFTWLLIEMVADDLFPKPDSTEE